MNVGMIVTTWFQPWVMVTSSIGALGVVLTWWSLYCSSRTKLKCKLTKKDAETWTYLVTNAGRLLDNVGRLELRLTLKKGVKNGIDDNPYTSHWCDWSRGERLYSPKLISIPHAVSTIATINTVASVSGSGNNKINSYTCCSNDIRNAHIIVKSHDMEVQKIKVSKAIANCLFHKNTPTPGGE